MKIIITTIYENVDPMNLTKWINGVLSAEVSGKEDIEKFINGETISRAYPDPRGGDTIKTTHWKLEGVKDEASRSDD